MTKPRILFMGTPDFAVPALQALVRGGWPVIGVVTQPDRPRGRGRVTAPPPVKVIAEGLGLPVFQPEKIRTPGFLDTFRIIAPDLVVVAAFGQILPGEIIHGPKGGCINIHPSLLPKYRGAAPIQRTLICGEEMTGVTIMRMDEGVDSGDILLQQETPIGPEETFGELHDRLANMGADLLLIALAMLQTETLQPRPQDHRLATPAPRIGREECRIRWEKDCREIVSLIRGLSPIPCAFTFFGGKQLKIFTAAAEQATVAKAPGTVIGETAGVLRVAAGKGYVLLKEVQFEGKKRMAIRDFFRGCPVSPGKLLVRSPNMTIERKKQRSPREIAVEILNRIDQNEAHAEPLLDAALSGTDIPNSHDRGLLTELVYGTLRMRGRLDWVVGRLYRGDQAALETPIRNILRTGLYQLLFTDRIPSFAAVNETVGIAKKRRPAAAGLVNAILRNALREKENIDWPEMVKDPGKAIAVFHSHPRWLVERWLDRYGIDETVAICRANNRMPEPVVRVNSLKASRDEAIATLATEKIIAGKTRYCADGLLLSTAVGLRETAAFRDGLIRVQDEASQLVAHLVNPQPGERILDLCAGAGGKTLHMAALMENRGQINAVDLHPDKLRLLTADAGRLAVKIVTTHAGNAATMPECFHGAFDRVLLDAPCSGLGTLRHNPEIRWRIVPSDLEKSMSLQKRLLRKAADCVKPGGLLAYSVCTVTPEENESVVADLLSARPGFKRVPPEGIPPELIDADGFLRTFPHRHGTDGFFGAVFVRI